MGGGWRNWLALEFEEEEDGRAGTCCCCWRERAEAGAEEGPAAALLLVAKGDDPSMVVVSELVRISGATLILDAAVDFAPLGFAFGPGLILVPGPIVNGNPLGTNRSPDAFTDGALPDEGNAEAE